MGTSQGEIALVIERFIRKQFRIGQAASCIGGTHLFESGFVDSAGVVELIAFLEKTFAIRLDDDRVFSEDFTTINGIAGIVDQMTARPV